MQQFSNFKNELRIKHQKKPKNLSKKIDLQNLIDQIMNFEKNEVFVKAHKRSKHDDHDANFNEQKNNIENDSKRFRHERKKHDRDRDRDNNKNKRDDYKNDRINAKNNNFNHESINRKKIRN